MKISLFISGLGNGGAERVFIKLFKYFKKMGHDVELVCATNKGDLAENINLSVNFLGSSFGYSSSFRYYRYLIKRKPDVVIATLSSSIVTAALVKFLSSNGSYKLICRIANVYQKPKSLLSKINLFLQKFAVNISDGLIANSNATLDSVLNILKIETKNMNSQIIGNPVLEDDFSALNTKKKRNYAKSIKRIVIIGRFVPQKRIDHSIKAFFLVQKKIKNCKLTVIGDGPERKKIKQLIESYQIEDKVELLKFCPDVPKLLSNSNCMICTSKFEGFGNVFIEGLAFCENLISYKSIGGASELLKDTSAILVEDGNINELANSIIDVLQQNFQKNNISINYLKNFTVSKVGEEYLAFIKDVVNDQ
jgi:glycosyltransferase involved in cell wall biosynthesis